MAPVQPQIPCADYAEQDEVRKPRERKEEGQEASSARLQLRPWPNWWSLRVLLPPLWFPELSRESVRQRLGSFSGVMLSPPFASSAHSWTITEASWWTGPLETKTEEQGCHGHYTPPPPPTQPPQHPRAEQREQERAVREQWAEREREMERGGSGLDPSRMDRDKVREGPRSRSPS